MVQKERILYWDVIKAFAIFLVVYGHCLRYLQVNMEISWDFYIYGFIYSFHMALFMIVSGYFARSIYTKSFSDNLKSKTLQILLPSVSTYIVVGFILIYLRHEQWGHGLVKLGMNCFISYWFLKALYILYVVSIVFTWICRKSKYMALVGAMFLFILLRDDVEFVHCMSMLPFFLIGMLLHRFEPVFWRNKLKVALVSAFICAVLCWRYDAVDYNMYMHPFRFDMPSIYLFVIRTLIGTFASLLCIILIRLICDRFGDTALVRALAKVGTMTLGIYVFHTYMVLLSNRFAARIESLNIFGNSDMGNLFYEYGICLTATFLFMAISILIILILRKNKYSRLIFLGEK